MLAAALHRLVELREPRSCARVGELDDQDAVLRDQADERDETDLRVDVERRGPALGRARTCMPGGPENLRKVKINAPNMASGTEPARMTKGSRNELNCAASTRKMSRIARPIAGQELAPLLTELARLAGVVDAVTSGQDLLRRLSRATLRPRRASCVSDAGDLDRVELLEAVQRARLDAFLERSRSRRAG